MVTSPANPDGNNGIFKSQGMSVTLTAGAADTLHYSLNGVSGTSAGSKVLNPVQGTNILTYYAEDTAGNMTDEKVYVFEYDSMKPSDVTLTSAPSVLVNAGTVSITG